MKKTRESESEKEKSPLRSWLEFYQDLGLTPLVRRRERREGRATLPVGSPLLSPSLDPLPEAAARLAPPQTLRLFEETPESIPGDTLERIREDIGDCQRCKLSSHRTQIVFGCGNPRATLVFVGEAPGADEDAQGLPFVGRAGQLLNQWIKTLGLKREEVYIANVIKCRPPGNRAPEKDEVQTCTPFLFRQLQVIRPKLICCLGSVALGTLVGKNLPITRVRGQFSVGSRPDGSHTFTVTMPGGAAHPCGGNNCVAYAITACQMGAAPVRPVTPFISVLSAFPTHTPTASCGT